MRILKYPDPILNQKAKSVKKIDRSIHQLAKAMLELMYKENGVGLAANQVGKLVRLVVLNLTKNPSDEVILINPRIIKRTGEVEAPEGCLSVPGINMPVCRSAQVVCEATNLEGEKITFNATETLSRAIQHEIDHLNGILFINRLKPELVATLKEELSKKGYK